MSHETSSRRAQSSTGPGRQGLDLKEDLIFNRGQPGRVGMDLPALDVPAVDLGAEIPAHARRAAPPMLPEVSEVDVVRHYTRLSRHNYAIDHGTYPLGSCTMKYNPKVNEQVARLPGFNERHPYLPDRYLQGPLRLMYELQRDLAEIAGFSAVTLQPAAGAHGELTGVMVMRAALADRGNPRKRIIVPDTAHGTNPATGALNGYAIVPLKTGPNGTVDPADVAKVMDDTVAGIMVTNPNTIGIFEANLKAVAEVVHGKGGLVYGDGANLNAIMGKVRPGDVGIDVLHINLHKTFATPHGGGGPGSGPVGVVSALAPYLPRPVVIKREDGSYGLDHDRPKSIGRVRSFLGNFGIMVRAYAYIREMGGPGLTQATELAVLNANYVRAKLRDLFHLPYETPSLHEVVFSDKNQKAGDVATMDMAKRLMDKGFHPPTVYFPLVVPGAIMIEPTETESRQELDEFIAAMREIAREAREQPDLLHGAPHFTALSRLDEVKAAREPRLRFRP
jgi:glycine dehydrogenase subunit 2